MQNLYSLFTTKESRLDLESLHFPAFSAKHCECEIGKTDGHGKSRNGHEKVVGKYVVKSYTLPM